MKKHRLHPVSTIFTALFLLLAAATFALVPVSAWATINPDDFIDKAFRPIKTEVKPSSSSSTSYSSPSGSSGQTWTDPTTGMKFVWVPEGCYMMGQTESEKAWLINRAGKSNYDKYFDEEMSSHRVCVDGFWMAKHEVTRGQFLKFVEATGYKTDAEKRGTAYIFNASTNWKWKEMSGYSWRKPGYKQTDDHPAAIISWNDANAFINWLSKKSSAKFRLPTEAEWEYAARAGSQDRWFWGNDMNVACEYANAADKDKVWAAHFPCDDKYIFTAPVGTYKPNAFGLYDMVGNLWEWCADVAYSKHSEKNPKVTSGIAARVVRGGSWFGEPWFVRSAIRGGYYPDFRFNSLGFRLLRTN